MHRIVITGATSFIGINLIRQYLLTESDICIYAVVRKNSPSRIKLPVSEKVKIIELDMEEYFKLASKINEPCDSFFSLAWNGTRGFDRSNAELQNKNFIFSCDVLNAALELGCNTFITAGSQAEYGLHSTYITEETAAKPVTAYGKSKLQFYSEAKKKCMKYSVRLIEPRFFSLYGEGDSEKTMIMDILNKMLHDQRCDMTLCIQNWDFMHIHDAASALVQLVNTPTAQGVYNFGSGICKPLKEYIMEMYKLTNSKSELAFGAIPYDKEGMVNVMPNIQKMIHDISFKPIISFSLGIMEIIGEKMERKNEK